MTPKQVIVDETTYLISPISLDQAEDSFLNKELKALQQNRRLVMHSLNNSTGSAQRTPDSIGLLPFNHYSEILQACLELNGLKSKELPKGGDNAAQGSNKA